LGEAVSVRIVVWFAVLSLGSGVSHAHAKPPRKIAVARFTAPSDSRARQAVLDTLSDHRDLEVVPLEDLEFASRRVHVELATPEGRAKVSSELGIEAWIDAEVEGAQARISLTSVSDGLLASVTVRAPTPAVLDALVGERMWQALGPSLSDAERARRARIAAAELARAKIAARQQEYERQVKLMRERTLRRVERMRAERALARKKQDALVAEMMRQKNLVAEAERRQREADEIVWQAELKRQADEAAAAKAEEQRRIAEVEERRKQAEADRQRELADAERTRQEAQAEHERRMAEAEKQRQIAEAERKRQLAEAERQRQLAQEEKRRLVLAEAEQRQHAEVEQRRLAEADRQRALAEVEQRRQLAAAEARRALEEAQQERALAAKQRELIQQQRLLAEAERQRQLAEAERQRAQRERQQAETERQVPAKSRALSTQKAAFAQPSPWQLADELPAGSAPPAASPASLGGTISPATARWLAQQREQLR
jgi:hypothetical protein